uniref:Uncharacterized protein n=1 Tax=Onchocerca volvulus TaxID=6282 RepID=A0A8R1XSK6_ONCVO
MSNVLIEILARPKFNGILVVKTSTIALLTTATVVTR